jgi:hypothetical protein
VFSRFVSLLLFVLTCGPFVLYASAVFVLFQSPSALHSIEKSKEIPVTLKSAISENRAPKPQSPYPQNF